MATFLKIVSNRYVETNGIVVLEEIYKSGCFYKESLNFARQILLV